MRAKVLGARSLDVEGVGGKAGTSCVEEEHIEFLGGKEIARAERSVDHIGSRHPAKRVLAGTLASTLTKTSYNRLVYGFALAICCVGVMLLVLISTSTPASASSMSSRTTTTMMVETSIRSSGSYASAFMHHALLTTTALPDVTSFHGSTGAPTAYSSSTSVEMSVADRSDNRPKASELKNNDATKSPEIVIRSSLSTTRSNSPGTTTTSTIIGASVVSNAHGRSDTNERQDFTQTGHRCHHVSQTMNGKWDFTSMTRWWSPSSCELHKFSSAEVKQCLKRKRIVFFGDSLLLRLYHQLTYLAMYTADGETDPDAVASAVGPGFYRPGGHVDLSWKDAPEAKLEFWWSPSSYGHQPLRLMGSAYSSLDIAIIGVGAWDMGAYYRGTDEFFFQVQANLEKLEHRGPRVIVNNLHKFWRERCVDKHSPCFTCNSPEKEDLFRQSIREAVACAYRHGWGGGELEVFSTLGLTRTHAAQEDGSDAVHFGSNTSWMETQVLLNMICEDEGGKYLSGKPETPAGNCEHPTFNEQLTARTGEGTGSCVADGWVGSHN